MNHKKAFLPRFILLMLLMALPVLACSALSGGDEDNETTGTAAEAEQADSAGSQDTATGSGESNVDEPAGDAPDSSADADAGSAGADSDAADTSTDTDAASAESGGSTEDTADAGSSDDDSASSDAGDGDSGDSDAADSDAVDSDAGGTDSGESDSGGSDSGGSDSDLDSAAAGSGASGDGWGESDSGPQSACDHPYLPLRTGSTWTYNEGEDTLIWEVTDVQGDLNNATAVLKITVGDVSIDYHWSCAEGTGLASFDFANVGSAATGMEMTLEQENAEGQFLLPADQLQPGATWETNLESAFTFTQGEGDLVIDVSGDMTTKQTNEVLSVDPVTFDGQTVDGVQIKQTDDISMVMVILENPITQSMNIVNTKELGRGIGLVSQDSLSDFGPSTIELVSYFIP